MSRAADREGDGPEEGEGSMKVTATKFCRHAHLCVIILTQINQMTTQPARGRSSGGMAGNRIYNVWERIEWLFFCDICVCVCVCVCLG